MYFITVPELEEKLKAEGRQVLVLKPGLPLMSQLLAIPSGSEIMATVPDEWPVHEKERFTARIHEAILHIEITRNTIGAFQNDWIGNAIWNYEAAMAAIPIDRLIDGFKHATKRPALIIGSGPSAKGFKGGDFISYAAWSSSDYDFQPNFIGHCDGKAQEPGKDPMNGVIFTPSCSFEFIKRYSQNRLFVYFDRGNAVNWQFAAKRGLPDHEPILGNVVDMLAQCAIYGGHKQIKFIGIDLCCRSEEELFHYHPTATEAIPAINYRGEQVFIDEIFQIYARGLEGLAERYPEIEFSVLSDQGVILEGIPYEAL